MVNEKRLIDAVRYREVLDRYINAPHVKMGCSYSGGMSTAIGTCISFLDNQPTVDAVEVVHGRWERVIPTKSAAKWSTKVSCSVCHKQGYTHHKYCPNCGAKMDAKE